MKSKLSPLEELRREKEIILRECEMSEYRLKDQFSYLSDNAVSLLFNSAVNGIIGKLGFSNRIGKSKEKEEEHDNGALGFLQGFAGNITSYLPLIWEIAQPVIWRFAMKKIKSIFSRKKKKKDDDD